MKNIFCCLLLFTFSGCKQAENLLGLQNGFMCHKQTRRCISAEEVKLLIQYMSFLKKIFPELRKDPLTEDDYFFSKEAWCGFNPLSDLLDYDLCFKDEQRCSTVSYFKCIKIPISQYDTRRQLKQMKENFDHGLKFYKKHKMSKQNDVY